MAPSRVFSTIALRCQRHTPILAGKRLARLAFVVDVLLSLSAVEPSAVLIEKRESEFDAIGQRLIFPLERSSSGSTKLSSPIDRRQLMSREESNKAVVVRWSSDFWGKYVKLSLVAEIAGPDMLLKYSLHGSRRGHAGIKAFMTDFPAVFPDLNCWGPAALIAEGDYVGGQWEGGGAH